jgi:PPOX class probable F420-dependent enzyme
MPGATLNDAPAWALELLATARVAHLGLLDGEGRPRVLPITFARVGAEVWSAVDDKPKRLPGEALARVRWLRERPVASLTADRYDEDWSQLAWIQLVGEAEVLPVAGHEAALDALAARYPAYRQRTPRGPLVRLTPRRVLWWNADTRAR